MPPNADPLSDAKKSIRKVTLFAIFWTLVSTLLLSIGLIRFWRDHQWNWVAAPCSIERFEIEADQGADPPFRTKLRFRYTWQGTEFIGKRLWPHQDGCDDYSQLAKAREVYLQRSKNGERTCIVNPDAPQEAALTAPKWTDATGGLVIAAFGGGFALIGIAMLWELYREIKGIGFTRSSGNSIVAAVSIFFAIVGYGMFFGLSLPSLHEAYFAQDWIRTPCQIVWSHVARNSRGDAFRPEIFYRYTFQGREYHSNQYCFTNLNSSGKERKQSIVDAHPAGANSTCYVNPQNPWDAVIKRDLGWRWLFVIFPLPFMTFGTLGLRWAWRQETRSSKSIPLTRKERPSVGRLRRHWRK